MNQITNILSGLKKRKASPPPSEAPAAAAHPAKKPIRMIATGLLVLLVASMAGGWWLLSRKQAVAPPKVVQAPAKPAPVAQPIARPVVAQNDAVEGKVPETAMPKPAVEPEPVKPSGKPADGKPAEVKKEEPRKADVPSKGEPKAIAPEGGVAEEKAAKAAPPKEMVQKEAQKEAVAAAVPVAKESEKAETAKSAPESVVAPPPVAASLRPHAGAARAKRGKAAASPALVAEDNAPEAVTGAVPPGEVDKQVKPLTPQQQAGNEFIRANILVQQGNVRDALAGYETALQLDPGHEAARQAMVVLLLQAKRNADAERVLQEGLKQNVKNSGFAMLLARIQLDRDAPWSALLTLQKTLPYAAQQADYQAFIAALLQRLNHHKEAVAHYQAAVELAPDAGVWWMGMGISLRALQKTEESRTAFKRALETHTLNAELKSFVNRQLREL